ncbi:unnamed protein product [Lota lota]
MKRKYVSFPSANVRVPQTDGPRGVLPPWVASLRASAQHKGDVIKTIVCPLTPARSPDHFKERHPASRSLTPLHNYTSRNPPARLLCCTALGRERSGSSSSTTSSSSPASSL